MNRTNETSDANRTGGTNGAERTVPVDSAVTARNGPYRWKKQNIILYYKILFYICSLREPMRYLVAALGCSE